MKTVFSTAEVHPRDRFDYWHSVACKEVVDHDSNPQRRQAFEAQLQSGSLADIGVVLFENSPMAVSHAARHIAQAKADDYLVCRQVAGRVALEQDSREFVLVSGDMTMLDPQLPYLGKFAAGSRMLVFKIPRSPLETRVGNTREMIARLMRPSDAECSLTSAFLAILPDHEGRLGAATEAVVKEPVLDLLAISLSTAVAAAKPRLSSARSLVFMKLRVAVEARLADPMLDAETVAAAAGVSVRYANAVLAGVSTSIMRLVQTRRLARCRRAFDDPSQAHRMVSDIAYSWGFSDMTHFGRRFRDAYGLLPSEYRKRATSV
jgi:AraC family transcriptional regulator, positive regulator of tynA and feaB